MARNKKASKRIGQGDYVQFLSGKDHPNLPGIPQTIRGTVTSISVDGVLTILARGKTYTRKPKVCLKVGT